MRQKPYEKLKIILKKFWFLLWKDDSLKGWIFSLLFIFIFIKFIFFPTLNLITGTSLPLAIVESCSMHHQDNLLSNFDNWWESETSKYDYYSIQKEQFETFSFKRGFTKGDILFVIGAKPGEVRIGDVIIFNGGQKNPLIHRVIKIKETKEGAVYSTLGDNNNGQLEVEKDIKEEQIIGKAVLRLAPYAGWGKLVFYDWRKPKSERGFCHQN